MNTTTETTTRAASTCCYEGCDATASEYDNDGDLACPLHAAQSERYEIVTDLDDETSTWCTADIAERVEAILAGEGWRVEIREPNRSGEAEGTYRRGRHGLQILGYSIPTPDALTSAVESAWNRATSEPSRKTATEQGEHDAEQRAHEALAAGADGAEWQSEDDATSGWGEYAATAASHLDVPESERAAWCDAYETAARETARRMYRAHVAEAEERARALGVAAGALFAQENPGEALDPSETDWDSAAWETDRAEFARHQHAALWPIYQGALVAETERLAG